MPSKFYRPISEFCPLFLLIVLIYFFPFLAFSQNINSNSFSYSNVKINSNNNLLIGCWQNISPRSFVNKYGKKRQYEIEKILCFKINNKVDSYSLGLEYMEGIDSNYLLKKGNLLFLIDQECLVGFKNSARIEIKNCSYEGVYERFRLGLDRSKIF